MEQFQLILEAFNAGEIPPPEPRHNKPEPIRQQMLDMPADQAPKRPRFIINGVERMPGNSPKQERAEE